jgi:hypothetical protein
MKPEETILKPSLPRKLINNFPYLLIAFGVVGFLVQLVLLHSVAFTLRSSVIFVPSALAGLFLLRKNKGSDQTDNYASITNAVRNHISFKNLLLINVLLLVWSFIVLLSFDTRSIIFFVLSASIACVIVLQILHDVTPRKRMIILFEICALSLSLAWGLDLKYALYFGYTDTMQHMYYISTVINTGHVYDLTLTYTNFPLYHIFISEGVMMTGMGIGPALFIMMGLAWLVGIVLTYLISSKVSNSTVIGLFAALIFAISPQIIFYSSYTISRSLGFLFFIVILYLIFNKNEHNKLIFTILAIFMSWALILTHHITVMYVVPLLVVIYLVQRVLVRDRRPESGISATFVILFATAFIGYMFFVSFETTGSWITAFLTPLLHDNGDVNVTNTGNDYYIRSMYYILCVFFAIIGAWYLLQKDRKQHLKEYTIGLSSLLFLPLFIPGVIDAVPGSSVLLTYRLPLLVSPFIAIILGYGILHFVTGNKSLVKASIHPMISIISILAIVSICGFFAITGAAVDTPLPWNEGTNSDFFNVQETTAFANLQGIGNHSIGLSSDDYTDRDLYQLSGFTQRSLTEGNTSSLNNCYVVLRLGELESRGVLQFGTDPVPLFSYSIDPNDPGSNIILQLAPESRVYDNGVVQTFLIPPGHNA